jgi:hypothetical protein
MLTTPTYVQVEQGVGHHHYVCHKVEEAAPVGVVYRLLPVLLWSVHTVLDDLCRRGVWSSRWVGTAAT